MLGVQSYSQSKNIVWSSKIYGKIITFNHAAITLREGYTGAKALKDKKGQV